MLASLNHVKRIINSETHQCLLFLAEYKTKYKKNVPVVGYCCRLHQADNDNNNVNTTNY